VFRGKGKDGIKMLGSNSRASDDSAENRDKVSSLGTVRTFNKTDRSLAGASTSTKNKGKTSREFLRVRSNTSLHSSQQQQAMANSASKVIDNPNEAFDYFYKIIIIGDELVGKTNFLLRLAKGYFEKKPKTTYGVEFEFKTVPLPNSN
jgi:predicted NACHT family NTPase